MSDGYLAPYNDSDYMYSSVSDFNPANCASSPPLADPATCDNYSQAKALYALQGDATSREYLQDAENNYWLKLLILFNYVLGIFVLVYAIYRLSSAAAAPSTTLTLASAAKPP